MNGEAVHKGRLTERDIAALRLASLGYKNEEIADAFNLALKTVEKWFGTHDAKRSISVKIGVRNKQEAIAWYCSRYGDPKLEPGEQGIANLGQQILGIVETRLESDLSNAAHFSDAHMPEFEDALEDYQSARMLGEMDRQTLLKVLGLLALSITTEDETSILSDIIRLSRGTIDPSELALRLLAYGQSVSNQSWTRALPLFREAEKLFGRGSSQAAMAGLEAARMLVYLGDYAAAQAEIFRVRSRYALAMDPEARARSRLLLGWTDYYLGRYESASRHFRCQIELARELGIDNLGVSSRVVSAQHYLAMIAHDSARFGLSLQPSDALYAEAERLFDESYDVSRRHGLDLIVGFEYLRKAQLKRDAGDSQEARELLDRARTHMARTPEYEHIRLEEAEIEFVSGLERQPKRKAHQVLEVRSDLGYASGMADALDLLEKMACVEGRLERALEYFLAAACLQPNEQPVVNKRRANQIDTIVGSLYGTAADSATKLQLQRLKDVALARRGPFAILSRSMTTSEREIDEVFRKLASRLGGLDLGGAQLVP